MKGISGLSTESKEVRGTTSEGAAATPAAAPTSRLAGKLSPENVAKIGSLVLLSVLAILPILVYISSSFRIHTEAGPVGFTFSNYVKTFTQPEIVASIWNTLIIALGTAFFSSIRSPLFFDFHPSIIFFFFDSPDDHVIYDIPVSGYLFRTTD